MEHLSLFTTPVFVLELPDVADATAELATRLTAEAASHPGIQRSNVGGWHSVPDLTLRRDACYQTVIGRIVGAVRDAGAALTTAPRAPVRYGAQAWAMVMRPGDSVMVHDHADAHWSTAYYVDAGDAPPDGLAGALAFVDPRRSGRALPGLDAGATFHVRPRTGMLVIFPGWLQHYVHPYRGTRPRIAISCNVAVEPAR